jgi:lactoylglutathione lyase
VGDRHAGRLRTIVVEREAPGGQAGTSSRIDNHLGFPAGVSGDELASCALQQARRLGAEILVTRSIERIDAATRQVHLDVLRSADDHSRLRGHVAPARRGRRGQHGDRLRVPAPQGAMSSARPPRLGDMSETTKAPTTLSNIGVVMFTVADQDAALAFYTEKLGFEVRSDSRFGEHDEMRWLEVAPPGSRARLALNPPMADTPGGSAIGVETKDVLGEHARLRAVGGVDVDEAPMQSPGTPLMFMLRDPDGNTVVVVEAPPA